MGTQVVTISELRSCTEDINPAFWQLWEKNKDYLFRCCLKWMNSILVDAEDALSRVMLKAWEKFQKYSGEITNFKAWLTRLTHNLCVDIHKERNRGANRVENIEVYSAQEEQQQDFQSYMPLSAVEIDEEKIVIHRAIANLPTKLRETFILHFYEELFYAEIAQLQDISYQNVRKRISQARAILQEGLRRYFIGEDASDRELSATPTSAATESAIVDKSKGNVGVEGNIEFLGRIDNQVKICGFRTELGEVETAIAQHPAIRETVVIARENPIGDKELVADKEVQIVAGEEPKDAALSIVQRVPAIVAVKDTGTEEMSVLQVWESLDYRERGMGNFLLLSYSLSSLQSQIPTRESIRNEDEDSFPVSQSSANQPNPYLTQVYGCEILPAIEKQDLLHSLVQEMLEIFRRCWRVWMDSGGCWLS
nr:sigma-70 family RNA polymerase sigma factor [Cylindrospermum sp. FACHB-282]